MAIKDALNIVEVDGSPSTYPYKLKVTNGTLTDNADGTATLTISSGGIGGSTGATDNRALRADGTGGATVQNSLIRIDDDGQTLFFNSGATNYIVLNANGSYPIIGSSGESALCLRAATSATIFLGNSGSGHTLRWYTDDGNANTYLKPVSGNFYIEQNDAASKTVFVRNIGAGTLSLDVEGSASVGSDVKMTVAGGGLYVKEGTNATMGIATLVAGTVTVSTTEVTANSRIHLTTQTLGTVAVPKTVGVTARSAGTSFTITSADATDTSTVAWMIVEPA